MQRETESKFAGHLTVAIVNFLLGLGLEVRAAMLNEETFLPGILVQDGCLLIDESKLIYPGDLLHEAGHLAVTPGHLRATLSGEVVPPETEMDAMETASIAWSYAALIHLGLNPRDVFHAGGYKGHSEGLLMNFSVGVYPGAHDLQALGMTALGDLARQMGVPPFPHMLQWMRD